MDDTLAEARAQTGLPHPYFVGLRDALEGALGQSDGGSPRQLGITSPLQALAKSYSKAVEQYAKTGNPGLPPPGESPTQSERLQERWGSEPDALLLRAQVQAAETQESLEHRGPLLALKLELLQGREGQLLRAAVVESSGNNLFDAFVLRVGPEALGRLAAPPLDAYRGETLRSVWEVNGWLRQSNSAGRTLAHSLAPSLMGVSTGPLVDGLSAGKMRFEYRARLLRVY